MGNTFTSCTNRRRTVENRTSVPSKNNSKHEINSNIAYSHDEPDLLECLLMDYNDNDLINRLLGCTYGKVLNYLQEFSVC
ncbi:unnamed protein product [Adineta steineri]|uniref:Uncharacterized protein n=1 Tax=Adineta steineri TaxID=433720 RepID=A0A819VST4_9BILA|nr:unnamed protein product [Adineta steineri]